MRLISLWLLLAVAGAWWGVRRLDVDVDILSLLPADVKEVRGLRLMREHFESQNDVIILIEAEDGAAADSAVNLLKQASPFEHARVINGVPDINQAAAALAWTMQNALPEKVRAFAERLRKENLPAHLERVTEILATTPDAALMQRLSYDPLGLMEFLSDGDLSSMLDAGTLAGMERMRLLRLLPPSEITGYKEAVAWLDHLKRVVGGMPLGPDVKVRFSGEIAFMAEAGGGMERDLSSTIGASMVLIALLFWIMYRRVMPLLWITLILFIVLGITIGIGTVILGGINAMNLGFAAIVLGLVVDYGVLIYQESAGHEAGGAAVLRAKISRSIIGGAVSTVAVFWLLCLSSFPGLREMGLLVGIGVAVGAAVMITTFPAIALRHPLGERRSRRREPAASRVNAQTLSLFFALIIIVVLTWKGMPAFDGTSAPLRSRDSEAMAVINDLERRSGGDDARRAPLLVVAETADALRSKSIKGDHWLPLVFLPDDAAQRTNRPVLEALSSSSEKTARDLDGSGFEPESARLFDTTIAHLRQAFIHPWPMALEQSSAQASISRFVSMRPGAAAVLGWTNDGAGESDGSDVYVPSWSRLGGALASVAIRDALMKMLPLALIFLLVLFIVLRSWRDVLLTLAAMIASFAALFAIMSLCGLSWNLASIAAIPLLVGTAEDYAIHMLVALRRERGDVAHVRETTGRAILFCGISSSIGFASLMFATNGGISSLGLVCALGLLLMTLVSLILLPRWWSLMNRAGRVSAAE